MKGYDFNLVVFYNQFFLVSAKDRAEEEQEEQSQFISFQSEVKKKIYMPINYHPGCFERTFFVRWYSYTLAEIDTLKVTRHQNKKVRIEHIRIDDIPGRVKIGNLVPTDFSTQKNSSTGTLLVECR